MKWFGIHCLVNLAHSLYIEETLQGYINYFIKLILWNESPY